MVATKSGIKFARTAKRLPVERRWSLENLEFVQSAPWRRYKEDKEGDGDIREGMTKEESDRLGKEETPKPPKEVGEKVNMWMYLRRYLGTCISHMKMRNFLSSLLVDVQDVVPGFRGGLGDLTLMLVGRSLED